MEESPRIGPSGEQRAQSPEKGEEVAPRQLLGKEVTRENLPADNRIKSIFGRSTEPQKGVSNTTMQIEKKTLAKMRSGQTITHTYADPESAATLVSEKISKEIEKNIADGTDFAADFSRAIYNFFGKEFNFTDRKNLGEEVAQGQIEKGLNDARDKLQTTLQATLSNFEQDDREKLRLQLQDKMHQGLVNIGGAFNKLTAAYAAEGCILGSAGVPSVAQIHIKGKMVHISYNRCLAVRSFKIMSNLPDDMTREEKNKQATIGYDAIRTDLFIDLSKLRADKLLQTPGATESIVTVHGLVNTLKDMTWAEAAGRISFPSSYK